jgi:hypothetical protein
MDLAQKLTLAMSGGALLVSSLVVWQTYQSRRLTEATNRAVISVEGARMTTFKRGGGEILVTLENSGKAVAENVRLTYFAGVVTQQTKEHPNPTPPIMEKDPIDFGNIAPAKRATRTIVYPLPDDRDLTEWANLVVVSLKIRYTDEASGRDDLEPVAYSGLITGKHIVTPEMLPGPLPTLDALDKVFAPKRKH